MNKPKVLSTILIIFSMVVMFCVASCGGESKKETQTPSNTIVMPIPDMLKSALGGYTLEAEVAIGGVGTSAMTVDQVAQTAYFEQWLAQGDYTVTVTYFVMISTTKCVLATQTQNVTILADQVSNLNFTNAGYNTSYDTDTDNVTNLLEVTYGGDPFNNAIQPSPCLDAQDNDGDTQTDYPNDLQCTGYEDNDETSTGVLDIATGLNNTCALTATSGLKCWGYNNYGTVGDGTRGGQMNYPVDVSGLMSGVSAVSIGDYHACALTTAGGVKCWGDNNFGQLGDGKACGDICETPIDVPGLTSGVIAIDTGRFHTCVLTSGGGMKCWGNNNNGQLGDGQVCNETCNPPYYSSSFQCCTTPVDVSGLTSGVTAISAGGASWWGHTCALTNLGNVKCWGFNDNGQVGDGTAISKNIPVDVMEAPLTVLSNISAISAGGSQTCALTNTGGVKCWGSNFHGELGDGQVCGGSCPTPVDVAGLTSGVAAIAAGGWEFTCALTIAGGAKCWGWNNYGEVGDGSFSERNTPVDVSGLTSGVADIAAGGGHACALLTPGGDVKCWGYGNSGQIGDGNIVNRALPVDVVW